MKDDNRKDGAQALFFKLASWIVDHKNVMIPVSAGILILIAVAIAVGTGGKKQADDIVLNVENVEEEGTQEIPVTQEPLQEDAYPEVNQLIYSYYQALADGNLDTLDRIYNKLDETDRLKIQKKSDYIDHYENIICYTKPGPIEDSFMVFASYEVKFKDYDSLAPGMNVWYVHRNEAGEYFIDDDDTDWAPNLIQYLKAVTTQDDIVDLNNRINVAYNDVVTNDKEFGLFLTELPDKLKAAIGKELAAQESPETVSADTVSAEPVSDTNVTGLVKKVKAKEVVNVRKSDSETADKLGKVQADEVLDLVEKRANGWTKVIFEGQEAYIKSEYLEDIVEDTAAGETAEDGEDAEAEETDAQEEEDRQPAESVNLNVASGDVITVPETINVRKSQSETAERLGVCYQGEQLEILMVQADGWTRVKFKGQTGYVKSELLQ